MAKEIRKESEESVKQSIPPKEHHGSAFNEKHTQDDKVTKHPEEESDLEQQRKETLTERD